MARNRNFFNGPNSSTPSLRATETVTGPNAPRSMTFTTPDRPGDYYFLCDLHGQSLSGLCTSK